MKYKIILSILIIIGIQSKGCSQIKSINANEANEHIGEIITVCGTVVSSNYNEETDNSPVFLNLEKPYPDHIFTIFIVNAVRDSFSLPPEEYFLNKSICVTGVITKYKEKPEIVVNRVSQISVKQ